MEQVRFTNCEFLSQYLHGYFPDLTEDEESYEEAYLCMAAINKVTFCNKLKEYREAAGYTQNSVCKILNVTQPTLSAWETGKHLPKPDVIKRLYVLYNLVDPVYFLVSKKNSDISAETSIPVLPSKLFINLDFDELDNKIKEFEENPYSEYMPVLRSQSYDFAFHVEDLLMYGERNGFPIGTYLLCNYKFLEGKTKEERLKLLDGYVSIISYKGHKAVARQIFYSEKKHEVSVVVWNPRVALDKSSPIYAPMQKIGKYKLMENATYSEEDVEVFGIVVDFHGTVILDKG